MADPVLVASAATVVSAFVTYAIAPVISKLTNRDKSRAEISTSLETAAVGALRSALDGLQEENSRLHEAVARQDARIRDLDKYIEELEERLRAKGQRHNKPV